MCSSNARLRGLYRAVNDVIRKQVPGDIVECGTARGSAALMALTLEQANDRERSVWVFDTFEGLRALPPTIPISRSKPIPERAQDLEDVSGLFSRLAFRAERASSKGLFRTRCRRARCTDLDCFTSTATGTKA
jgi:hypothetical protein